MSFPKATLPVDLRRQTLTTSHCEIILVNTWVGWTFSIKRASNEQYRSSARRLLEIPHFTKQDAQKRILQSDVRNLSVFMRHIHKMDMNLSIYFLFLHPGSLGYSSKRVCGWVYAHTHILSTTYRFLTSLEKCLRNPTDWLSSLHPEMMTG